MNQDKDADAIPDVLQGALDQVAAHANAKIAAHAIGPPPQPSESTIPTPAMSSETIMAFLAYEESTVALRAAELAYNAALVAANANLEPVRKRWNDSLAALNASLLPKI